MIRSASCVAAVAIGIAVSSLACAQSSPSGSHNPDASGSIATSSLPEAMVMQDEPWSESQLASVQYPAPHITLASPAPSWTLPDRMQWIAMMILAVLGYAAVLLAISLLRKIERQTQYAETAANAARETAQAALLHAQAILRSERPWIVISVEPTPGRNTGSTIVASNRGKTPARIVATIDRIVTAAHEADLPPRPDFSGAGAVIPESPLLLFPAESTCIRTFDMEDVRTYCATEERLKQVEDWEQRVYVYGKVTFTDLLAPAEEATHETCWCCWFIYGKAKMGLVILDLPAYNVKS